MVQRGLQEENFDKAQSILSVRWSFLIATEPTFTSLPRSGYGYSRPVDILTSSSSPPSSTISRVLRPISPSEGRSSHGSTKRTQSNLGSRRRRSGPGPCGVGDNLRTFATAVRAVLLDADRPRDASSAGHGAFFDLQRSHLAMEETASSRLRNGGSRRRSERTGRVRSESFRSLTWQIERIEI